MNIQTPFLSLLSRRSPTLQKCRACYYATLAKQPRYNPPPPLPPDMGTTPAPHYAPTQPPPPSSTTTSPHRHYGSVTPPQVHPRARKLAETRDVSVEAARYLVRLESGELLDGDTVEELFKKASVQQSAKLLKFAREAKAMTAARYLTLMIGLLAQRELVAVQLALNTMIEDGVQLSNRECAELADGSVIEYTLFLRVLALMDPDAWDYPVLVPGLAKSANGMMIRFYNDARGVRTGTHMGHLLQMVPHLTPQLLEAMVTSSNQPVELGHAYQYMIKTGIHPTITVYEHFAKYIAINVLQGMYSQMKSRGLVPPPTNV